MTDFYVKPEGDVSFGDIFEADFLHDVFLKSDAVQMGTRDVVKKYGGGLSYGPTFERNREFVLGRGAPYRALLLADNCLVDRILAQGRDDRRPQGRLLFAPIVEAAPGGEIRDFGRFQLAELPGRLPPSIVELRRCFMVDGPDVLENRERRVARLGDKAAVDLEVRWNAYATRRGPLANSRNAEKVADLAAHAAGEQQPDQELGYSIAAALEASWKVEGDSLEQIADAHAEGRPGTEEMKGLEATLRELGEKSLAAADLLAVRNRQENEADSG